MLSVAQMSVARDSYRPSEKASVLEGVCGGIKGDSLRVFQRNNDDKIFVSGRVVPMMFLVISG